MQRTYCLALFLFVAFTSVGRANAESGSLILSNGDTYSGSWQDCEVDDNVRWQPTFTNHPYEFPWGSIANIKLPLQGGEIEQTGLLRFDLQGGDMLVGNLKTVSPEWITVAAVLAPRQDAETIRIARDSVRGIVRTDGSGGAFYMGPDPLSEWKTNAEEHWRYAQGTLGTFTQNSIATRRLTLPQQAYLEIELSWQKKADFSLELGLTKARQQSLLSGQRILAKVNRDRLALGRIVGNVAQAKGQGSEDPQTTDAFRLETIANHLVVVRETKEAVDLAPLRTLSPGAGSIQLRLFLDQVKNRLIVTTTTSEQLADLQVPGAARLFGSGLLLHNRGGDIQLDKLTVSKWSGEPPVDISGEQHSVTLANGRVVHGEVVGYDADANKLLISPSALDKDSNDKNAAQAKTEGLEEPASTDGSETTQADSPQPTEVDLEQVVSIVFPNRLLDQPNQKSPKGNLVTASLHTGQRITGLAQGVSSQTLRLAVSQLEQPLSLPLASIRNVRLTHQANPSGKKQRLPLLEVEGTQSVGTLSGIEDNGPSCCLLWRPKGSLNAAPLLDSVSGRIVFREPARPKAATQQPHSAGAPAVRQGGFMGLIGNLFLGNPPSAQSNQPQPTVAEPAVMYLRRGDKLPCKVDRIDEHGVYFSSPFSTSGFAGHEHIKALELMPTGVDGRITSNRRDQLLTLPRMQSKNPPTHLLVSTQGDYLRCRLLSLTEANAVVEVRLEETAIQRSRVARIIWLDPPVKREDPAPKNMTADPISTPKQSNHPRVQAVRRDGVRLTFYLEQITDTEGNAPSDVTKLQLVGKSDVLDSCQVKLNEIDVLLLGDSIEHAAAELSYQRWKMQHAIEPRDPVESAAGDASTTFPLVGKPAPEVNLPYYAQAAKPPGKQFRIKDYQGRVLVLDFWASWCGPCMQAMPTLHDLGEEFADQGVQVVAVNLQDSNKEIKAALNRLKITPLIALDRDGVAAQRYQVTGIPQTVVIDRNGDVANVFVGGGNRFEDRVRAAIQAALKKSLAASPVGE